jgi:hypothetical protein
MAVPSSAVMAACSSGVMPIEAAPDGAAVPSPIVRPVSMPESTWPGMSQ